MAEHCRKLSWLPCHCAGIERQRMAMAEQMSGSMPAGFSFTRRRAAWTLGILLIVYTLNYADRVIISTIGEAIRIDLKLSDTQLGLLGGLAFALFYAAMGIPMARLAERGARLGRASWRDIEWQSV